MGFYEEISKYYDFIFPTGKDQVNFITGAAGEPPKDILDVACGAGGYSLALAKEGYNVTAIDLDEKMIETVARKASEQNLKIKVNQGNMLELPETVHSQYDLIFCIGNSLVHLDDEREIGIFLQDLRKILHENGSIVLQIINYNRVLKNNIQSLPTIENDKIGLRFERLYRYDTVSKKILFKTVLTVDGNTIENEIPLYPILTDDMVNLLEQAGFQQIQLFGDFKGTQFDPDTSFALVINAK